MLQSAAQCSSLQLKYTARRQASSTTGQSAVQSSTRLRTFGARNFSKRKASMNRNLAHPSRGGAEGIRARGEFRRPSRNLFFLQEQIPRRPPYFREHTREKRRRESRRDAAARAFRTNKKYKVECPNCKKPSLSDVGWFNMMFRTNIGPIEEIPLIAALKPRRAYSSHSPASHAITEANCP